MFFFFFALFFFFSCIPKRLFALFFLWLISSILSLIEPRQLRSYPRKSARECFAAPAPIQKCPYYAVTRQRFELDWFFFLIHLSDISVCSVVWGTEIHLSKYKARQTHPHATPPILFIISVRGSIDCGGPYERPVGEHSHRGIAVLCVLFE